jgi:hypothetical protein
VDIGRKFRNKEPKTVKEALDKASKLECRREVDKETVSTVRAEGGDLVEGIPNFWRCSSSWSSFKCRSPV